MRIVDSIRVLLYPIDNHDRKRDAEHIENNGYTIDELMSGLPPDVSVLTLSEFMDLCNNEEFNPDSYWVSYIRILDYINKHNRDVDILVKSCEEGRDGDWDVSTNEGLEGFDAMITQLNNCYIM
jgi:hypothetical protein